MRVKELIEKLKEFDRQDKVYLNVNGVFGELKTIKQPYTGSVELES